MGLLTIIRKTRLKEKQMRILMLGLDNAGKTTVVKRILGEDVNEVSPTLGFNIKTIFHRGYSLNVWDIGGQTSLRPYWRNYFETTDAVIWVVDSSDRERMENCRRELKELLQEERLVGASLLVLANKQDISGAMTSGEIAQALQLSSLVSHTSHIQACSARIEGDFSKGDDRIWAGLDWIVQEVGKRVYYGTGEAAIEPKVALKGQSLEAL